MDRTRYIQLSILFFLHFFIWGSWYVTTGTYLLQTVGFSGREVGLIYGATAIAATVTPFLLGLLADRLFATEKLLALLHAGGGVLMFGISYLDRFAFFYPALILYAMLYMPTFALTSGLTFHYAADGARDYPRVRLWGTLGWIIAGVLIGILALETTAIPMRISAAASMVQAVFCISLPHTPPQKKSGRSLREFLGPEVSALLRRPSFVVLMISLVLISIPSGFYYSFTNSFLTEMGVPAPAATMSAGQISETFLMLLMPFFFRRLGFKWVIAIGLFTWGFRYLLFALGNSSDLIWMLYTGILLHGVAFNFTALTGQIYIDREVPVHVRNTAQGFMSLLTLGLGALIGSYIAGEVVGAFTLEDGQHLWPQIWLVPAAVGGMVTVGFLALFKPKNRNTLPRRQAGEEFKM